MGKILSANIVYAGLGFVTTIIVLRNLNSQILGVVYPLIAFMMLLKQFGDFGLGISFVNYASRYFSRSEKLTQSYFSNYFYLKIILSTIISLLGILLAKPIGLLLFSTDEHTLIVQIVMIVAFFQSMTTYYQSIHQIQSRFNILAVSKVLPQLIKLCGLVILLVIGKLNLELCLFFFLQVPLTSIFWSMAHTSMKDTFSMAVNLKHTKKLFISSRWIWLSALIITMATNADILMTRSLAGADELAILLGGQKLAGIFPIITSSLIMVLLPKVGSMKNKKELSYYLRKSLPIMILLSLPLLLLIPFSELIISLVIGEQYSSSASIFNIYLVTHIFIFITNPASLVFYRLDKESDLFKINCIQLLINLIGNFLLIPTWGAIAAATMTLAGQVIASLILFGMMWKNELFKNN